MSNWLCHAAARRPSLALIDSRFSAPASFKTVMETLTLSDPWYPSYPWFNCCFLTVIRTRRSNRWPTRQREGRHSQTRREGRHPQTRRGRQTPTDSSGEQLASTSPLGPGRCSETVPTEGPTCPREHLKCKVDRFVSSGRRRAVSCARGGRSLRARSAIEMCVDESASSQRFTQTRLEPPPCPGTSAANSEMRHRRASSIAPPPA